MVLLTERDIDRFVAKFEIDEDTGCWNWLAGKRGGYGQFRLNGKMQNAHRVSFAYCTAGIPEGKHLDHLCRNRGCVNPVHLEIVTNRENVLRGEGACAKNLKKTHCPKGHEYTPENTYTWKTYRYCRICVRERGRNAYWRDRDSR